MGNIISYFTGTNYTYLTNDIFNKLDKNNDNLVTKDELEDYFKSLSDKIDKNNDGVISKEELEDYLKTESDQKDIEIEKWRQLYEEERLKTELLEEENKRLRAYLDFATGKDNLQNQSFISTIALKEYIKNNILKTDANLKYIPDLLEKKAYFSMYKTMLESLEQLCNTTYVNIMNHKISMIIEPDLLKNEHE